MKVYETDKKIIRDKVRANPDVMYLFGDNLIRKGLGGQAKEMRGDPNCFGVVTKKYPNMKEEAFFTDADYDEWNRVFKEDCTSILQAMMSGRYVALVIPPLGTGLADLPNKSPKIWKELQLVLGNLKEIAKLAERK